MATLNASEQLKRGSKVYLTLLIARCVEPDNGSRSRPRGEFSPRKTSARGLAEHANIDHKTVTAYLSTWDAMAADGLAPSREDLEPGET